MPSAACMRASLEVLATEFPDEKSGLTRLFAFIDSASALDSEARELGVRDLQKLLTPASDYVIAKMLTRLASLGIFERIVRVKPNAGGAATDYTSITDVPLEIYDSEAGRMRLVRPNQIHLIHRLCR